MSAMNPQHVNQSYSHDDKNETYSNKGNVSELTENKDSNSSVSKSKGGQRETWVGRYDFLVSAIGFCVGLGNIWRFPYLCYEHGGGAFLVPYFTMLLIVAFPIFYIEMAVGQFSGRSPIETFQNAVPIMGGIGIGMVVASALVSIYYNAIIGWSFYYLFSSFQAKLPWASCQNEFNTDKCFNKNEENDCHDKNGIYFQASCYTNTTLLKSNNDTNGLWCDLIPDLLPNLANETSNTSCSNDFSPTRDQLSQLSLSYYKTYGQDSSQEFWFYKALKMSSSIDETGEILWFQALCLLLAWVIVCLCLIKGVKSLGKVVYFTSLFPYVLLTILLIRGVTLDGAANGISFYLIPDFTKLAKAEVWSAAASQVFFSLGNAFGGVLTLASYNGFHNNILRDSVVVGTGNALTSVYGGFVVFSFVGFTAKQLGQPIDKVMKSHAGLTFIAYPSGVSMMGNVGSIVFSILFFFMLFLLGIDSQFALVEVVLTAIVDQFSILRKCRWLVTISVCSVLFLLGLPMTTQSGYYWLSLLDYYSASYSLLIIGIAEIIAIMFIYGSKNMYKDIELMLGWSTPMRDKLHMCHKWLAMVIAPITILGTLVFTIIQYDTTKVFETVFPNWAHALGWIVAASSIVPIPLYAGYSIFTYKDKSENMLQRLKNLTNPTESWGPSLPENRVGRYKRYSHPLRARTPEQEGDADDT